MTAHRSDLSRGFLKAVVPYLKQVAGLLVVGSLGGLVMNTAASSTMVW